jgi:hypothetical protein
MSSQIALARRAAVLYNLNPLHALRINNDTSVFRCGDTVLRVAPLARSATAGITQRHLVHGALLASGVAVVRPKENILLSDGVHVVEGWEYIPHCKPAINETDLGANISRMQACSEFFVGYDLPHLPTIKMKNIRAQLEKLDFLNDKEIPVGKMREDLASLEDLPTWNESLVFAHGDISADNVLMSPTGPVLCDFERCGWAPPSWDIAGAFTQKASGRPWCEPEKLASQIINHESNLVETAKLAALTMVAYVLYANRFLGFRWDEEELVSWYSKGSPGLPAA